jgi:hypothetical protein
LTDAVQGRLGVPVLRWERGEYATVLGALLDEDLTWPSDARAVVAEPEPALRPEPAADPVSPPLGAVVAQSPGPRPVLRGVRGPFAGQTVELGSEPVVIGRDPQECHLVVPIGFRNVSKRHCSVRYDANAQCFVVEDLGSTNGTFAAPKRKIRPNVPCVLAPHSCFYLATHDCTFEVDFAGAGASASTER